MIRRLAALSLLLLATAAQAQQPSQAERQRLAALGSALGRCHHGIVLRDARGRFTAAQIADRAMAGCAMQRLPKKAIGTGVTKPGASDHGESSPRPGAVD